MSKLTISISGERTVLSLIEGLIPSKEELRDARQAAAEIFQVDAQRRAPAGIEIVTDEDEDTTLIGNSDEDWYARFLEYGTTGHVVKPVNKKALKFEGIYAAISSPGGISARPFLRPAYDENKEAAIKAIKEALGI